MNPAALRSSSDAMTTDGDPRFYLLGRFLDDLADEVEAGIWPARDWVPVHCPCCGLGTWRAPGDDLAGDDCPYCGVQSVRSDEASEW